MIDTAYQLIAQNCQTIERNQACYGHAQLSAQSRPGYDSFAFENTGDVEDLVKIQSLRLSGLDTEAQTWGIAPDWTVQFDKARAKADLET